MKLIKLVEVYEDTSHGLTSRERYALREVIVNPDHVIVLRDNQSLVEKLRNDLLPEGLDPRQEFTKLTFDGGHSSLTINVVGDIDTVSQSLLAKKSCGRACN